MITRVVIELPGELPAARLDADLRMHLGQIAASYGLTVERSTRPGLFAFLYHLRPRLTLVNKSAHYAHSD